MEAQQCAREPTGTNWPTLHETTKTQPKRLLATTIRITLNPHPPTPTRGGVEQHKRVTTFAVVIVVGKRPETFRTRKLSPQTPMVLHPTECGRVGHRRNITQTNPLLDHHSKRGFTTTTQNTKHKTRKRFARPTLIQHAHPREPLTFSKLLFSQSSATRSGRRVDSRTMWHFLADYRRDPAMLS